MKAKIFFSLFLIAFSTRAQVQFQRTYGGNNLDEAHDVIQTADEGYLVVGFTTSVGAGNHDVYLIKTNNTGDTLWTKTYGGIDYDYGFSIIPATGGGYIIAGRSNHLTDYYSAYLLRIDSKGDTLWTKSFGGYKPNSASAFSVQQTFDKGFVFAGDVTINGDVGLFKTDSTGKLLWAKAYGGSSSYDIAYSVQQTSSDSGFILGGYTNSFGAGYYDFYLIKTDKNGDTLWTRTFGSKGAQTGWSVLETRDHGYIIAGSATTAGTSGGDAILIKTDTKGDTLWTKTYGGTGDEIAYYVSQTHDGGFIVTGAISDNGLRYDVLLMKTDSMGKWKWSKSFGGPNFDVGWSVKQTADNGYIIAGYSNSFTSGNSDFYLIKTDENGNSKCNEGNPVNAPDTFFVKVGKPATIVSSGVPLTSTSTTIGNGSTGVKTSTLCLSTIVNEVVIPILFHK